MRHRVVFPAFLLVVSLSTPSFGSSQQLVGQAEGWIEILEPSEWQGAGTRGLAAFSRTSIRVVGVARHPGGVREVQLNGKRASLQPEQDGSVRFVGYIPTQDGLREVEVMATSATGRPFVRKYTVDIQAGVPPAPALAGRSAGGSGERWAVIVGVSQYADNRIDPLEYADDDARALFDFLTSEAAGLGGFKEENIRLLLNEDATYREIRTALFTFLKGATEDDLVLIYFAGHGMPDPDRTANLYLLSYDTDVENVSGTAFPMEDVHTAVQRTYARDILVLSDACHSAGVAGQGAFRNVALNQINELFLERLQASTGGLAVFTASQVNQLSQEGSQWGGGHGVFTHHLIEALRGAADEDQDRIVTLGEVTEWVRDRVRRETRNAQIPSLSQTAFDPYLPLSIVPGPPPDAPGVVAQPETPTQAPPRLPPADPGRQEEATPVSPGAPASAGLLSPGAAAGRSLLFPGLGHFYTGQKGKGAALMAVGAGVLAAGLLVTSTTEDCAITPPAGTRCPLDWLLSSTTKRPLAVAGVAGFVLTAAYAAYDAHKGAKEANARISSGGQGVAGSIGPMTFRVLPPALGSGGGKVALQVVRLRF